ncbi:MAG: hypothetical protein JEZ09_11675 [Salinivirgaceae bacterium]|nr:hypothetical protein [Salinivirgaceae bacterium]
MDIYRLIYTLLRKVKYLVIIPILAGITMYLLTLNQPKKYSSKSSIFSGVASNASLENLGNSRVDYFANKAAYNNLLSIMNSQKIMKETALRLLAQHLVLNESIDTIISRNSFIKLQNIVPEEINKLVDKKSEENTYKNLLNYITHDKQNFIYGLLNYDYPYYSYNALSKIDAKQAGSSDIIEIKYQSDDPGITYQTILILIKVFMKEYGELKINQSDAVVEYFENQLKTTSDKLSKSEDQLLAFNTSNRIINFYEQTKHISSQQEKIEVRLQELLMEFQAAKAIVSTLETETKSRFNISLTNKQIIDLRKSLVKVNQTLTELKFEEGNSFISTSEGINIISQKKQLEKDLKNRIDSLYIYNRNSEGIDIKDILNEWLTAIIEYESANAQLLAMQVRKKEFDKLYAQYAPLGAELKRIERKINVTEEEYLEILHHLGLAKLKLQNQEMMANMKILDEPEFPIDSEPTKRKIFVIVIIIFSFIFIVLAIIVFELLDKTIKTAQNLSKLSGLKTLGVSAFSKKQNKIDINAMNTNGLKPVVEKILTCYNNKKTPEVTAIQFLSHWTGEGKSHIIQLLMTQIQSLGYKVCSLQFDNNPKDSSIHKVISIKQAFGMKSYSDFIEKTESYDIMLVEVPALSSHLFNATLLNSACQSFLIADANRTWSQADNFILENTKNFIGSDYLSILNKAIPYNMEDVIGEVPKKRSFIRRTIKNKLLKRFI